jgi:hypothetical protein
MTDAANGHKANGAVRKRAPRTFYNCLKCPAYCCSYDRIVLSSADVERLARHFNLSVEETKRRYTKAGTEPGEVIMRQKKDEHFNLVCQFLDGETRRCTIYDGRPRICREFPGSNRCGYYDFLSFERRAQEDPEWVSTTG